MQLAPKVFGRGWVSEHDQKWKRLVHPEFAGNKDAWIEGQVRVPLLFSDVFDRPEPEKRNPYFLGNARVTRPYPEIPEEPNDSPES
jgi:hypothetical protein